MSTERRMTRVNSAAKKAPCAIPETRQAASQALGTVTRHTGSTSQQPESTPSTRAPDQCRVSNMTGTSSGPTIPVREKTEAASPAPASVIPVRSCNAVGSHPEMA